MNLHEYQAKSILRDNGLPVPDGFYGSSLEEVLAAYDKIGTEKAVAKCQAHTGGRGKAGGVKVVSSKDEVKSFAEKWLGNRLVTVQTGAKGLPVSGILIEKCSNTVRELYLGATIDRSSSRIVFMASTEGGMEIEKVAQETPNKIFKTFIDPIVGAQPYQGRSLAFKLGLQGDLQKQFVVIFMRLAKLFVEKDLSLIEVNPLAITEDNKIVCLDTKINIDSNALYRHKDLAAMNDVSQEDPREAEAQAVNLNYVELDGNIGCLVNGAGLAMGTMDIIKLYGGTPANFLDVGGSATRERVIAAFEIILKHPNIKCILVNIFGGIVRCDLIAEGIIGAVSEVGVQVPVVVRLEGNQAEEGLRKLKDSGLNILAAGSLKDAAELAVAKSRG